VLSGFPDRVAKRRGAEVLLASGGSAQLPAGLEGMPDLMVAVEAEERRDRGRTRSVVRVASGIEPEWLLDSVREETELGWEPSRGRVEAVTRLLYGQIVLEESRKPARSPEILLQHAEDVPEPELIARLKARAEIAGLRLTDDGIAAARLRVAERVSSLDALRGADFVSELFDPEARTALDRLAPEH